MGLFLPMEKRYVKCRALSALSPRQFGDSVPLLGVCVEEVGDAQATDE